MAAAPGRLGRCLCASRKPPALRTATGRGPGRVGLTPADHAWSEAAVRTRRQACRRELAPEGAAAVPVRGIELRGVCSPLTHGDTPLSLAREPAMSLEGLPCHLKPGKKLSTGCDIFATAGAVPGRRSGGGCGSGAGRRGRVLAGGRGLKHQERLRGRRAQD